MAYSIEEYEERWATAFRAAGHEFVMDDYVEEGQEPQIDWFRVAYGHHNGPECKKCGWTACEWCVKPENIPPCKGG